MNDLIFIYTDGIDKNMFGKKNQFHKNKIL